MIKETGRVVAIESDCLWVETIQRSACSSCSAKAGCGQSVMNKMYDGRRSNIRLPLDGFEQTRFNVNDEVEIGIPEEALMKGVAWVYVLPLLGLFAGGILAIQLFGRGDLQAIAGAVLGFMLSLGLIRQLLNKGKWSQQLQPSLLGKASSCSTYDPEPLKGL